MSGRRVQPERSGARSAEHAFRLSCRVLTALEDNTLHMRSRVARGLLRLTRQHRKGAPLTIPQEELGKNFGVSRKNVNRQLGELRTDSSDAVVDLAQRLCIAFDEPFVGIEVDGRCIRIYGDDTA